MYLIKNGIQWFRVFTKNIEVDLCILMNLFIFFFACDIVLSETLSDIQHVFQNQDNSVRLTKYFFCPNTNSSMRY